jgi:hypothetical protein
LKQLLAIGYWLLAFSYVVSAEEFLLNPAARLLQACLSLDFCPLAGGCEAEPRAKSQKPGAMFQRA